MKRILLIEDDQQVCSFVKKGLEENNFKVEISSNGEEGVSKFFSDKFDLILLDIMLPGISGLQVCHQIRSKNPIIPIILLTALGTAENVALGLNTGADDYIVKPFKFIELTARINSLIRRSEFNEEIDEESIIKTDYLYLDDKIKIVKCNNNELSLTSTEYNLLHYFLKNQNRVLSRVEILEHVWGVDFDIGTNVVDVYVNYLRKKIDKHCDVKLIHTVIGMGYILK